jgi:hypothetical protein
MSMAHSLKRGSRKRNGGGGIELENRDLRRRDFQEVEEETASKKQRNSAWRKTND